MTQGQEISAPSGLGALALNGWLAPSKEQGNGGWKRQLDTIGAACCRIWPLVIYSEC